MPIILSTAYLFRLSMVHAAKRGHKRERNDQTVPKTARWLLKYKSMNSIHPSSNMTMAREYCQLVTYHNYNRRQIGHYINWRVLGLGDCHVLDRSNFCPGAHNPAGTTNHLKTARHLAVNSLPISFLLFVNWELGCSSSKAALVSSFI